MTASKHGNLIVLLDLARILGQALAREPQSTNILCAKEAAARVKAMLAAEIGEPKSRRRRRFEVVQ